MKPKRILFPTDFSPCADAALAHALFHAEANDAELHIIHSVHWEEQNPIKRLPQADTIMMEMQRVAQVKIQEMLESHTDKPFNIIEKCMIGPTPAEVLLDYIQDNNIGMLVMGTHGRKGISHFLLGSVAEELIRMAPCPVITVRDHATHNELAPIIKILAPVDYSVQSKHSLHHARELAALHGAEVECLYVVHEFENGFGSVDAGFSLMNDMLPRVVEEQKKHLSAFYRDTPGADVPHSYEVLVGRSAWRITDHAQKNDFDYIVMGTHGYSGFNHLILGSTTERVVRTSPCPVYTVKVRS